MGKPLPFRDGVFSVMTSVAAVHYLTMPSGSEKLPEERLKCLYSEIKRVCGTPITICLSFFPLKKQEFFVSYAILKAAIDSGFSAAIVLDQPHNTDSVRWFIWGSTVPSTKNCPTCPVLIQCVPEN